MLKLGQGIFLLSLIAKHALDNSSSNAGTWFGKRCGVIRLLWEPLFENLSHFKIQAHNCPSPAYSSLTICPYPLAHSHFISTFGTVICLASLSFLAFTSTLSSLLFNSLFCPKTWCWLFNSLLLCILRPLSYFMLQWKPCSFSQKDPGPGEEEKA